MPIRFQMKCHRNMISNACPPRGKAEFQSAREFGSEKVLEERVTIILNAGDMLNELEPGSTYEITVTKVENPSCPCAAK
jgi:hypothetical protein